MNRRRGNVFAKGLQKSVYLLRGCGFIGPTQFPKLLGPMTVIFERVKKRGKGIVEVPRFIVLIGIRENFNPNKLWLKFDKRGQSVFISADKDDWIRLKNTGRF